jgi:hypothetical protein
LWPGLLQVQAVLRSERHCSGLLRVRYALCRVRCAAVVPWPGLLRVLEVQAARFVSAELRRAAA